LTAGAEVDAVTVRILITNKVDVNARMERGQTPLFWAAGVADADSVAQLLAAGAEVNAKAEDGETPLSVVTTFLQMKEGEGPPPEARKEYEKIKRLLEKR